MTPAEERLRTRLSADLRAAIKAREAVQIPALRSVLAALDNASAVDLATATSSGHGQAPPPFATSAEVPRRELTAQEVADLLAREIARLQEAALKLRALGRAEAAARALAELQVLEKYVQHPGI